MLRRFGLVVVLAVSASLLAADWASARGCRGGGGRSRGHRCHTRAHRGHHGHHGGGCGAVASCGSCGGAAHCSAASAVSGTAYAALTINLPEGATLTVNGQTVDSTPGSQVFYS